MTIASFYLRIRSLYDFRRVLIFFKWLPFTFYRLYSGDKTIMAFYGKIWKKISGYCSSSNWLIFGICLVECKFKANRILVFKDKLSYIYFKIKDKENYVSQKATTQMFPVLYPLKQECIRRRFLGWYIYLLCLKCLFRVATTIETNEMKSHRMLEGFESTWTAAMATPIRLGSSQRGRERGREKESRRESKSGILWFLGPLRNCFKWDFWLGRCIRPKLGLGANFIKKCRKIRKSLKLMIIWNM